MESFQRAAADYLAKANLAAADVCCRQILARAPSNAVALNLTGVIAAQLGLYESAVTAFEQACAADPAFRHASENLAHVERLTAASPQPASMHSERFLLIKAWGYGFWSDVNHVLGALLLAEITRRIPVVHWGSNSRFTDASNRDAFEFYFEPVSEYSIEDLYALEDPDFFPSKWSKDKLWLENHAKWHGQDSRLAALHYLNRRETIAVSDFYIGAVDLLPWIPPQHPLHGKSIEHVYRHLAKKYLCPRASIVAAIDDFFRRHLANGRTVAVHLRGSDKQTEMGTTAEINRRYLHLLEETLEPMSRIFLLTDDARWLSVFKTAYGNRVIFTDCQRTGDDTGIHYSKSADAVRLGLEIMQDTYLATRADRFIGNGQSNVSAMIALLKEWSAADCILLSPSVLLERNLRLYVDGITQPAQKSAPKWRY